MNPVLRMLISRPTPTRWLAALGLALVMLAGPMLNAAAAPSLVRQFPEGETVALTTDGELLRFNRFRPGTINARTMLSGLNTGDALVGIDFRPATGELYGVGGSGQVYRIEPLGGMATASGAPLTLTGTAFGVDFNPTVDRLRVVSSTGQNLRVNPDTGAAITDTPLAYAGTDPNAGTAPAVVGAAYTNNRKGATTTTLYDLDQNLDVLVKQTPANAGTLVTVGALGVDIGDLTGFDITDRMSPFGLAAARPAGGVTSRLYHIDLRTGRAIDRGQIGSGERILDIATIVGP